MSGGVDSSATAIMLKNDGYDVFGLTMNLLGSLNGIKDAKIVADKIGIEHHFVDLQKEFEQYVIQYFKQSYLMGETPSPCIMCNKHIKLGLLVEHARKLGANQIVTGHYAKIIETSNGVELHQAEDLKRDQSYFLFGISKENLQMLRLPLAEFSKAQTREIVKNAGLEIFSKPDSQDICFVSNGKYSQLFEKTTEGNIVDTNGQILGQHHGIINYTIGQRKGLGIGGNTEPLYVVDINATTNDVLLGPKNQLMKSELMLRDINLLVDDLPKKIVCKVKLRSTQPLVDAEVEFLSDNYAKIRLTNPCFSIAKGQGCCLYDKTKVLGGGIIC